MRIGLTATLEFRKRNRQAAEAAPVSQPFPSPALPPPPRGEITALTGLRGVAALAVTTYHFYATLDPALTDPLNQAVRRGYLMVDLFFVLSGLVMAMTYAHGFMTAPGLAAWKDFMLRRAARILPLYWVVLAGSLLVAWAAYGQLSPPRGGFTVNVPDPLPDILLNLLLVQSWSLTHSALVPAWSISTEWAAYLLFPLLVPLLLGRGWRMALLGLALAVVMLAAAIWITAHDGLQHGGPLDASSGEVPGPLLRCLAGFMLGMLCFRLAGHPGIAWLGSDGAALLLGGLLAVLWLFGPSDAQIYPLLPAVVLCLALNRGHAAALFSRAPLHRLGVLSYAIYLLHYQFAGALHWLEQALGARLPAGLGPVLAAAAIYGLLLGTAWLAHRLVELPGRRLVRGLLRQRAAGPGGLPA